MSALVITDVPEQVHEGLKRLAAEQHSSVEDVARAALADLVTKPARGGIDFVRLQQDREALGLREDGPAWDAEMDDPAFSRQVLGLKP